MTTPPATEPDAPAYSAREWHEGPEAVYSLLARSLLADPASADVRGRRCLDLGSGTGVVSRLLTDRGADVVEADLSARMLAWQRRQRPSAVVADARRLPLRSGAFDLVASAFCLNHIVAPEVALHEVARVLRPGGSMLASTWPSGPDPVKTAATEALAQLGWTAPGWYDEMRSTTGDPDTMTSAMATAGLSGTARVLEVPLDLPVGALVAWRAGVPQVASWLRRTGRIRRAEALARLHEALRPMDGQPWTARMIVLSARRAA